MRKKSAALLLAATALLSFATGTFAAGSLTPIKAYLNGSIKFRLDGKPWKPLDANGKEALPITYNGTTYLPLRVIAETLEVPIVWEGDTQTIGVRESRVVNLFAKEVSAEFWAEKFYDIADKKQLVFGGTQYGGAYAFSAENVGLGWYEGSPNVKFDFGKPYGTLHLVVAAESAMKIRVLNGDMQQLSEEISLEADAVTELEIDLQGSRYVYVSAYDADNQAEKPLLYVFKESYVTTAPPAAGIR